MIVPPPDTAELLRPVTLHTSGTTGEPKLVETTWLDLFRQAHQSDDEWGRVWLLTYAEGTYAWVALRAHCAVNGCTLVRPDSLAPEAVCAACWWHGVDAISATPTFWRRFAAYVGTPERAARLPLARITLGGEIADGATLERLRALWPAARLVHVYATTELGSCFAVSDGLPGFPAAYLTRRVGNVLLAVHWGELYVNRSGNPHGTYHATGDRVEIVGDRVYFRGRKGDTINVGGTKVSAAQVEAVLVAVPGVVAVRAYGQPNPVTGQLVAARVELAPDARVPEVEPALTAAIQALPRPARPVSIVYGTIPTANGKVQRRTP